MTHPHATFDDVTCWSKRSSSRKHSQRADYNRKQSAARFLDWCITVDSSYQVFNKIQGIAKLSWFWSDFWSKSLLDPLIVACLCAWSLDFILITVADRSTGHILVTTPWVRQLIPVESREELVKKKKKYQYTSRESKSAITIASSPGSLGGGEKRAW